MKLPVSVAPSPIHAFTIKYAGHVNRILTQVRVCAAFDPSSRVIPPPLHDGVALWDTGATQSVITESLSRRMALTPTGEVQVNHAGGTSRHSTYVVNFMLPNNMGIVGALVSECPDSAGAFDAIIGMDIIALGDFSITHVNKQTWMSFRMPSLVAIDYVEETNRIKYAGVGRNDPCPCGSGSKFKHCHGKSK